MRKITFLFTALTILSFSQNLSAMGKKPDKPLETGHVRTLIQDADFKNGFDVINPVHPNFAVVDQRVVNQFNVTGDVKPVWMLEQWHSKFNIGNSEPVKLKDGSLKYTNESMTVIIGKGSENADLILGMDSRPEYNGRMRKEEEPWPHLLVEQYINDASFLDKVAKIPFHLEAKLLHGERFEFEGYTPVLHCAQIVFVLIIKNDNPDSPGYMDFMWFGIPFYDCRAEFPARWIAQDYGPHSTKMIFNAGSHVYTNKTLWNGDWVTFDVDLRPLIIEGLFIAWERGYLQGSKNIGDYRIIETNMGWELTGINNVTAQIRNLSLKEVVD